MTAYPIKDFRKSEQYPTHRGINAWRWEFLRRYPKYQQFYADHKNDDRMPYCGNFGIRSLFDPKQDDAHTAFWKPSIIRLPTFEWVEKWKQDPGYTAERGMHMLLSSLTELQNRGDVLLSINTALPIEPQLQAIRDSVERKNERDGTSPPLRNDRRGEWPFYLRIMDALAEDANHDDIARALYPDCANLYPEFAGRKRVRMAAKRAKFLSETFAVKGFVKKK